MADCHSALLRRSLRWLVRPCRGAISGERCDAVGDERKRAAALAWNCGMDSFPSDSAGGAPTIPTLARLDEDRLRHIQTPSAWLINPRCMPYCFRCLVLNDADVSAPRCKHEWLEPKAEFCSVHHTLPETVPASVFRLSGHFASALRAISRYREMRKFKDYRRLR